MALLRFDPGAENRRRYRDENGDEWEVIGWITDPAAILVNARTGKSHVEIIGCMNAERFTAVDDADEGQREARGG